ncbi:MAG: mechanosensitive ion channel domain-containing protein [Balneolaceae bacterium]
MNPILQLLPESMSWSEIISHAHELLTTTLFQLQQTPVTILSILIFLVVITFFFFLASFTRRVLLKRILPRFEIESGLQYTLSRITYYIIWGIGLMVSIQFIGLDLSSLAVIFGLLSVGIGFGLQNITNNFISGLIVLFERPISVGDRVEVAGVEGDVLEINIRSTKIRTLNNISIIVPNQEFVGSNVVNYSHGDPTFRLDIEVGVSYGSDLDTVLSVLKGLADNHPDVMKYPKSEVHLREFGESSWNMELRVWVPNVKEYRHIRNELNQSIVRAFRENNIEIPFPQRDLNFKTSPIPIETRTIDGRQETGSVEK